jgi:hypothetical protein
MSKLTNDQRDAMDTGEFALPESRAYPLNDENHARNALARVSQFGNEREKTIVRAKVRRRFPNIHVGG